MDNPVQRIVVLMDRQKVYLRDNLVQSPVFHLVNSVPPSGQSFSEPPGQPFSEPSGQLFGKPSGQPLIQPGSEPHSELSEITIWFSRTGLGGPC